MLSAAAAEGAEEPQARRVANYRITASYDESAQLLSARQVLTWHNASKHAATELHFHLYLNAFANNRSSFMQALGAEGEEWARRHPQGWGYIEVRSLRIDSNELRERMEFIAPNDANIDDRTVFRLPLETPVAAGGSVEVEVDFVAKLPRILARAGYAGPFAMVAQWFPKIGVFADGAWICHQYHPNTEFFADFGAYDVTLTVPREGIVGTSGVLVEEHDSGNGRKTVRFLAEDVHDFAWTIDPRFRLFERDVEGVNVRLLLQPNHVTQLQRYLGAARAAIRFYADRIGAYPYPQLTVVDPGPGAGGAGGMEYPTLITVGTRWWMPAGLRLPEVVTVHEFGHQYWYGMVANNEVEEAWLDEGINSYLEGRIMNETYGPGSYIDLLGIRVDSIPLWRLQYLQAAHQDAPARPAWTFLDRVSYRAASYAKLALALDTLGNHLGEARMDAALRDYFTRWRFRHPSGDDFRKAVSASVGEDLDWFFDPVIDGTGILDYAVTRVTAREQTGFAGHVFHDGQAGEVVEPEATAEHWYHNEVVVERLGAVVMPVALQIVFDDGTNTSESWDGRERWRRFEYRGHQRVEWAVVDPGNVIPLDYNRLNNSRMRGAGTRGMVRVVTRWGFWFQSLAHLLAGL